MVFTEAVRPLPLVILLYQHLGAGKTLIIMSDSDDESPPDLIDASNDTSINPTSVDKKVPITIITGTSSCLSRQAAMLAIATRLITL